MTATPPMPNDPAGPPGPDGQTGQSAPGSWHNGLVAPAYVPLTDVAAPMAPRLLTALERARIPAYLTATAHDAGSLRLYVSSTERSDARGVVAAVVRSDAPAAVVPEEGDKPDPLAGIDADAAFAALVADWHVDTHTAIRDAEAELTREDEDWRLRLNQPAAEPEWLDEDHYIPPPPPPLPRLAAPTILAVLVLVMAIAVFAFGAQLGLTLELRFFLGVAGVLVATGLFILRLRVHRDEDDDGAVL